MNPGTLGGKGPPGHGQAKRVMLPKGRFQVSGGCADYGLAVPRAITFHDEKNPVFSFIQCFAGGGGKQQGGRLAGGCGEKFFPRRPSIARVIKLEKSGRSHSKTAGWARGWGAVGLIDPGLDIQSLETTGPRLTVPKRWFFKAWWLGPPLGRIHNHPATLPIWKCPASFDSKHTVSEFLNFPAFPPGFFPQNTTLSKANGMEHSHRPPKGWGYHPGGILGHTKANGGQNPGSRAVQWGRWGKAGQNKHSNIRATKAPGVAAHPLFGPGFGLGPWWGRWKAGGRGNFTPWAHKHTGHVPGRWAPKTRPGTPLGTVG